MLKVNNQLLMKKVRHAKTAWESTKGLMFEDKKKFNYALIFEHKKESKINSSIHMIFVFFPIDVLFLDKNKIVVDKVTLPPFLPNYTPKNPAKYVIEMPKGKANNIKLGSVMEWEE